MTNYSKTNIAIKLDTFKDMKVRVDNYLLNGGKITPDRRIYLKYPGGKDYVDYVTYQSMLSRYNQFISINHREPYHIYTIGVDKSIENTSSKCYVNPRYYSGSELKQDTSYYCGVNSVQQTIYSLTGKYYKESELAKLLGTTTNGTSPDKMVTVLKNLLTKLGYNVTKCNWEYKSNLSWEEIGEHLQNPKSSIIFHDKYKLQYGHYEVISKLCVKEKYMVVLNSLSGGYLEKRSFETMLKYLNAYTGKSVLVTTIK